MAKISVKNKFFFLPMIAPIMGIISVIVAKILLDLWIVEKAEFFRDCFFVFMGLSFCIFLLNAILVLLSIGFAFSKKISLSELAMNLLVNVLGSFVIMIFMASKM